MNTAPGNETADDALAQAKPPFLRRVRIRGYKSIAFCDVTLEPLTILVGRNASGKSNFLDALSFLRDAMEMGLAEALRRRGGLHRIVCRSTPTEAVEIELEAMLFAGRTAKKEYHFCYRVEIPVGEGNNLERPNEQLRIVDVESGIEFGFHTEGDRVVISGPEGDNSEGRLILAPDFYLRVDVREPDWDLAEALRYMGIYNFQPEAMRILRQPDSKWILDRDGSNIASIIASTQSYYPNTINRVGRYLSVITESIELIGRVRHGEYETVRFRIQGIGQGQGIELDAASMSDGTLRTLGALVAAFQIVGRYESPSLIAIEEPETSLHPAAMRALVDALDEATLRTQILLTTHSAEMLDNPTIKPANVRVVQMIDGQTVIGPVDEASVEIIAKKLGTLGGLERENQLEPDQDDVERQQRLSQNGAEPPG
jgi:predicted ATPase